MLCVLISLQECSCILLSLAAHGKAVIFSPTVLLQVNTFRGNLHVKKKQHWKQMFINIVSFCLSPPSQVRYKKCAKQNTCCQLSPPRKVPGPPLPCFVPYSTRWTLHKWTDPSTPTSSLAFHPANSCLVVSQQDLKNGGRERFSRRSSTASTSLGSFQRSKSLACLPTTSSSLTPKCFHFSDPNSLSTFFSAGRMGNRVNIDDLEGVQETDVDTGMKLAFSDLSVVSAYSAPAGFSKETDTKGKCPSQKQSVNRFKQTISGGRCSLAKYNPFDLSSSCLPFLFDWSSSSSTSPSASPSAVHFRARHLPRRTVFSLDDSRTTGGGKANEEEFYI